MIELVSAYEKNLQRLEVAKKIPKKRGRKPKETNKFIINLINGAKRIFSPE